MIQIHVEPTRIQRVQFICKSEAEEDLDLATWKAIRLFVHQIDKKLKKGAFRDQRRPEAES